MDKAPDAFRTISVVADDLDVPQHVLRFWETRFSQIKPMKRSGGRRYYRPDDVDLLRGIRRLLYGEGYTIRGVQRILKENGIKAVQGLVDEEATPAFAPVPVPVPVPARASEPRVSSAAPIMSRPAAKAPVVEEEPEEEAQAEGKEEIEDESEDTDEAEEEEEHDQDDSEEGEEEEAEEEDTDDEDGEEEDSEEEESEDEESEGEEAEPERIAARKAPEVRPPEVRTDPATPRVEPRLQQAIGRTDPATMSRANPMPSARANPASQPRMNSQPAPQPPVRSLDRERLEAVLEDLLAARHALDSAMKDGN